ASRRTGTGLPPRSAGRDPPTPRPARRTLCRPAAPVPTIGPPLRPVRAPGPARPRPSRPPRGGPAVCPGLAPVRAVGRGHRALPRYGGRVAGPAAVRGALARRVGAVARAVPGVPRRRDPVETAVRGVPVGGGRGVGPRGLGRVPGAGAPTGSGS